MIRWHHPGCWQLDQPRTCHITLPQPQPRLSNSIPCSAGSLRSFAGRRPQAGRQQQHRSWEASHAPVAGGAHADGVGRPHVRVEHPRLHALGHAPHKLGPHLGWVARQRRGWGTGEVEGDLLGAGMRSQDEPTDPSCHQLRRPHLNEAAPSRAFPSPHLTPPLQRRTPRTNLVLCCCSQVDARPSPCLLPSQGTGHIRRQRGCAAQQSSREGYKGTNGWRHKRRGWASGLLVSPSALSPLLVSPSVHTKYDMHGPDEAPPPRHHHPPSISSRSVPAGSSPMDTQPLPPRLMDSKAAHIWGVWSSSRSSSSRTGKAGGTVGLGRETESLGGADRRGVWSSGTQNR